MGSLQCNQSTTDKSPNLIVELTNTEDTKYETFNILGIQGGVELTLVVKYRIQFYDKGGTPTIKIGL